MSDDLEGRLSDYEARLEYSGGTDKMMNGLAESVRRNHRNTHILAGIIMSILVLMIGLLFYGAHAQSEQDKITQNIKDNTERIATSVHDTCLTNLAGAKRLNTLQRRLRAIEIRAQEVSNGSPALERLNAIHRERIQIYTDGIIPLVKCE